MTVDVWVKMWSKIIACKHFVVMHCTEADCQSTDDVRPTEYGLLCAPCREGMAKDHEPVEADALGLGE